MPRIKSKMTPKAKVQSAFRHEVEPLISEWRRSNSYDGKECPILGIPLTSRITEVDHVVPFITLTEMFLQKEGILMERVTLGYDRHRKRYYLKDSELRKRWRVFHTKEAVLRFVSSLGNKKKSDSNRRKKKKSQEEPKAIDTSPTNEQIDIKTEIINEM